MIQRRSGIYLEALPASALIEYAVQADSAGFDSVWFSEIMFADAFTPAAAAAGRTRNIHLGTGVIGPWSRSPLVSAMTAASLSEISQGRLRLGIGSQAAPYVNNWHGRNYKKPLTAVREYVTILQRILSGQPAEMEGELFRIRDFQYPLPLLYSVPVYIGAIGPRMIELAGELADGVLGVLWTPAYLEKTVMPRLKTGAGHSGRDLASFDITMVVPTLVTDADHPQALHRGQVMMFASAAQSSPFYRASIIQGGFEKEYLAMMAAIEAKDFQRALAAVSDDMVDALALTGTPARIRQQMDALYDAGVTSIQFHPSSPNSYFPLYQGHLEGAEFPELSPQAHMASITSIIEYLAPESST